MRNLREKKVGKCCISIYVLIRLCLMIVVMAKSHNMFVKMPKRILKEIREINFVTTQFWILLFVILSLRSSRCVTRWGACIENNCCRRWRKFKLKSGSCDWKYAGKFCSTTLLMFVSMLAYDIVITYVTCLFSEIPSSWLYPRPWCF